MKMMLRGTFVETPKLGDPAIYEDYLNEEGFITHFEAATSKASQKLLQECTEPPTDIGAGSFLLPTFCDLHLHAPQLLYQGNGLDLPLLEWLDRYTYKAEERLDSDPALARRVYQRLARRLVENGTGQVSLFGTIKETTNLILAEAMQSAGIRARIGKLSMDISSRPTYTEGSAPASLHNAAAFVDRCLHSVSHLEPHLRLVEPVLTPRFVPTCSDEVLEGLGALSDQRGLPVQSHLAEAADEVEWVRSTRGKEDIEVFDQFGLLTPRTLQAHCTFLTQPELKHLSETGTSVAHCPLSNIYFSTEPFPLREVLNLGVKVGLGTDVAGGYSLDIMNAMRSAVAVSRMRESLHRSRDGQGSAAADLAITWKEALYLATRGGASALGLSPSSGLFRPGSPFDAQQIKLFDGQGMGIGPLDFFDLETGSVEGSRSLTIEMIEKWWCVGDNRNRAGMWIQGNQIL